ncbi:MAG TPA: rod-binding protein [Spirochaetota bacterium]|nr:rod-binding protein [Spirochaetota bacterium]HOM38930.1 rod-binding protein [Spirochaetota bacterium]HPQ49186.1 rod-binding protein [Spirochaetota bacterium]
MEVTHYSSQLKDIYMDNSLDKIKNFSDKKINEDYKLKEVCSEFESIFVNQIFKQMRTSLKSINPKPLMDGGFAEDVFKDMLYEEYSKLASKYNSIGIADIVYNYLKGNIK